MRKEKEKLLVFRKAVPTKDSSRSSNAEYFASPVSKLANISASQGELVLSFEDGSDFSDKALSNSSATTITFTSVVLTVKSAEEHKAVEDLWQSINDGNGDFLIFDEPLKRYPTSRVLGIGSITRGDSPDSTESTDSNIKQYRISNWTLDTGDLYYADITHNFNTQYVIKSIYNADDGKEILVEDFDCINSNTCRIYVRTNAYSLWVTLINGFAVCGSSGSNETLSFVEVTQSTTVAFQSFVLASAVDGPLTITLPKASTRPGGKIVVQKIDITSNYVTIDGDGTEQVAYALTQECQTQGETWTLYSNGQNWYAE